MTNKTELPEIKSGLPDFILVGKVRRLLRRLRRLRHLRTLP
jgi:hypothetical protein